MADNNLSVRSIGGQISNCENVSHVMSQRSILSPLFFIINDLPLLHVQLELFTLAAIQAAIFWLHAYLMATQITLFHYTINSFLQVKLQMRCQIF